MLRMILVLALFAASAHAQNVQATRFAEVYKSVIQNTPQTTPFLTATQRREAAQAQALQAFKATETTASPTEEAFYASAYQYFADSSFSALHAADKPAPTLNAMRAYAAFRFTMDTDKRSQLSNQMRYCNKDAVATSTSEFCEQESLARPMKDVIRDFDSDFNQ